jgi:hypothetical protein
MCVLNPLFAEHISDLAWKDPKYQRSYFRFSMPGFAARLRAARRFVIGVAYLINMYPLTIETRSTPPNSI